MIALAPATVHATAVALGGDAVLIRGVSGAGKSDLALRCIAVAPGGLIRQPARLVADDRVLVSVSEDGLQVTAPPAIAGRIEVRGLGILSVPSLPVARLRLIVDLVDATGLQRLPAPRFCRVGGHELPWLDLAPFEASAPVKLLLALATAATGSWNLGGD